MAGTSRSSPGPPPWLRWWRRSSPKPTPLAARPGADHPGPTPPARTPPRPAPPGVQVVPLAGGGSVVRLKGEGERVAGSPLHLGQAAEGHVVGPRDVDLPGRYLPGPAVVHRGDQPLGV